MGKSIVCRRMQISVKFAKERIHHPKGCSEAAIQFWQWSCIRDIISARISPFMEGTKMTKKKRRPVNSINDVLMPSAFVCYFANSFEEIQARITREAFANAYARKTGPDVGYVIYDDVAQAARNILPKAISELLDRLTPNESHHAPRKTA